MNRHPQSDVIWNELRNASCKACDLHKTAQTVCLLGDGPVPCDGMIIGEAPGLREDNVQVPFSGKSGLLLRRTMMQVGLDPRKLFITNTVACRPPANRTPSRKEAKACTPLYLVPQIERVNPKAILLLGNVAVQFVTGKKSAVTKMEGTTINYRRAEGDLFPPIPCVPSRHPSSVLRAEGEKEFPFLLQQLRENLLLFKRTMYPVDDGFRYCDLYSLILDHLRPYVYTDIETNGLNPFIEGSVIHSIALAQVPGKVACDKAEGNFSHIHTILRTYGIIAHRGTFEGIWLREKYGITPRIYHDTKLCAYLKDENQPTGLKIQAISKLNVEPWVEEQDWQNPDFGKLLPYNARDVQYGVRLYREHDIPFLKRNPKIAKLMRYILLPATEVLTEMIWNGYHINVGLAKKRLAHCQKEKKNLNDRLNKIAGQEVNPGSPKQMSKLFYKQLRLECPVMTKGGKKNGPQPSTSEAALIRLRGQHEATDILWDWRGWDKKESTYLEPWIRQGPILHALYDDTGTDTGRLSSSMIKERRGQKGMGAVIHQCPRDPFIRNLISPRGYVLEFDVRTGKWTMPKGKLPDPENWCIAAADLSQIELRLSAHAANEPTMIQIFKSGGDIHTATVRDILKCTGDIDKETRKKGKAVNFGFVYGMMPPKFVDYCLEKFDLKISQQDGKDYRRGYFRKYSGLAGWHQRVEAFVTQNGWIDSVFGRRRHLPSAMPASSEPCDACNGDKDCFLCGGTGVVEHGETEEWVRREAVRQAINSPIQGAASDLLLLIVALIASYSLEWDYKIDRKKVLPIGSAHDSMLFECHKSYAKTLCDGIKYTVKNLPLMKLFGLEFRVPIEMDVNCYSDCWEGKVMEV